MKKENGNDMPFKADEVNWDELSGIGIMKDELELSGEMDTLLRGEKTKVMSLSLVLLGVDVVMDATLQLVRKGESPLLEIQGVTPLGKYSGSNYQVNRCLTAVSCLPHGKRETA